MLQSELEPGVAAFLAERPRLFRIAYRIVGEPDGADDVVQEAWLRWQRCNRTEIESPAAFLTTATTHLAINVVQSAARRHEMPTDALLDEPVDREQDPTRRAELTQDVEQAFRLLVAQLTPAERAAYLLRKGFDYPYSEIAALLRTTVSNARQLVCRAQGGLARRRSDQVDPASHRRLVRAFMAASRTGSLAELERLLTDGGGPTTWSALADDLGDLLVRPEAAPSRVP
jgi:RNA polymerase sigma factor (sigma-70 family)